MQTHVDEVNQLAARKEKEVFKQRQEWYRRQLEDQMRENSMMAKQNMMTIKEEDRRNLDGEISNLRKIGAGDEIREKKNRMMAINIMDGNLKEKQRLLSNARSVEQQRNKEYLDYINRANEDEKLRKEQERLIKQRMADELRRSYEEQEANKRKRQEQLRELDKIYSNQYNEKVMNDEKDHQKVKFFIS